MMRIVLIPFAVVAVMLLVSLISAIAKGRVGAAIVGLVGLLLVVGGLFFVGSLFNEISHRHVAGQPPMPPMPRLLQHWPFPRSVDVLEPSAPPPESVLAEMPEESESKTIDASGMKSASSAAPARTGELLGPPRPAWMDAPMGRVGDVYRTVVTVGPWMTRGECENELPEALGEAVKKYAVRFLGEEKGRHVHLDLPDIHKLIVRGEWAEHRQQEIDTMIYLHALLEFDDEANKLIDASARESMIAERLGYTATGGGLLLGLLTIVFGYLKLDTLTRGYYTGRLRLTAAAAILGLAAIAGFLVMS